jgi:hypothetical protein
LQAKEQAYEPIIAGEYVLGFYQDASAFLPEHFALMWLDRENGILAIAGKLRSEPETQRVQSIFFAKDKMWDDNKIRDWLLLHPHYMANANVKAQSPSQAPLKEHESLLKNPKTTVHVEEVVKMIQNVLPSPMVERSWGFGSQRLCQELRGIIFRLRQKGEAK